MQTETCTNTKIWAFTASFRHQNAKNKMLKKGDCLSDPKKSI